MRPRADGDDEPLPDQPLEVPPPITPLTMFCTGRYRRRCGASLGDDLTGGNLSSVNLTDAKLDRTTLAQADFTGADLSHATLFDAVGSLTFDSPAASDQTLSEAQTLACKLVDARCRRAAVEVKADNRGGAIYWALFLVSWAFCWRSFSSAAFRGTSLTVSLSTLPVNRNGGW